MKVFKKTEQTVNKELYLFIGDSYGIGAHSDGVNWIDECATNLGLSNYYKTSGSAYGFVPEGKQFISLLETIAETITDRQSVSHIVVGGGLNDNPHAHNDIVNAIKFFINKANELFPRAKVYIGMVGGAKKNDTRRGAYTKVAYSYSRCADYGGIYLSGVENCLSSKTYFPDDETHPNATGQHVIARAMTQALRGGYFTTSEYFAESTITPTEEFTIQDPIALFKSYVKNDFTVINLLAKSFTFNEAKSVSTSTAIKLGVLNKTHFGGGQDLYLSFDCTARLTKSDGTFEYVPVLIQINAVDDVQLIPRCNEITDVKTIATYHTSKTFLTALC